ncbi:MAG: DNA polymerase [Candidatus Vogelbacteria bacterium]
MPVIKEKIKTLVLLDVHAILHRAYHALPDFTSSAGEPTGGLYGLASMLMKIIKDLKPDYLAACYDLPETTFRKAAYDAYKAGRKPTDDALISQIKRSRDLFTAFNIPIYEAPGFEADDVIGTIAGVAKRTVGLRVVIASGDLDTLQLVDDKRVLVYTLKKGIQDTILYDETAVVERFGFSPKYLPDWKGLRGDPSDNIIGIKGIGEKTATTIIKTVDSIEKLYQVLANDSASLQKIGLSDRIIKLLREGEDEARFSKTLATIRLDAPVNFQLSADSWKNTFDKKLVENFFTELGFRSLLSRLAELGREEKREEEIKEEIVTDPQLLAEAGIMLWLLNSDLTTPTAEDICRFSGVETVALAREKLEKELEIAGLREVYEKIERPLISILTTARERGIRLDVSALQKLSNQYHSELRELETKIFQTTGKTFNLNSPKQLGEILFDTLHLSVKGLKKTAGGARSTRESELEKLREVHPVVADILAYRELQKLLSTYVDALPKLVGADGALHTRLEQTGTTTGRMSSRDPNLQNIPAEAKRGQAIRRAFVARADYIFATFDYSQIEMRVLAVLSQDQALLEMFKQGGDIHTQVAGRVFAVAEREVTKEMRRQAKVINFGIIYGMGVNALKQNLDTDRATAQNFYNRYFESFPMIRNYFEKVKTDALKSGFTETMFGRRRYLPALRSPVSFVRASAERMALNAPLQGTAADIVKLAIIRVDERLKKEKLVDRAHLLLQVHDELLYEIVEKEADQIIPLIKQAMENIVTDPIPFTVKVETGPTWGEMTAY